MCVRNTLKECQGLENFTFRLATRNGIFSALFCYL